jgi:anti-sigma factor RsiW
MNCNEARRLIEANADAELELTPHLELEEHFRTCAACSARAQHAQFRRTAIRETLPRFTASPELAAKIRASLRAEAVPDTSNESTRVRETWFRPLWRITGLAAAIAIAAGVGYDRGGAHVRAARLTDELLSAHVRSLQADHLADVASTDQHTVKPWFVGKLDFSPPVVDLASTGFPLVGGRLEHLDGRPAAALIYQRRQHAINLIVWPAETMSGAAARQTARDGFHVEMWTANGFHFAAVSEIPAAELADFAVQFRSQVVP